MYLYDKLAALERPVSVAVVGAGDFGAELICQISHVKNMRVMIIGDLNVETGKKAFIRAGFHETDIAVCETLPDIQSALERDKRVVTPNALLIAKTQVDAVCDVTGSPSFGAELAFECLTHKKHVVVVNIESDVAVGNILSDIARENGVVYTEADGDQPSLIKGLYDWAKTLGIETIVAGKWTKIYGEDLWRTEGSRSTIGYADGSKNQVEMCCVANMTGLAPDIDGMHKKQIDIEQIPMVLNLRENGGILNSLGVVDVVNTVDGNGKLVCQKYLGGGVFIVGRCPSAEFQRVMRSKDIICTPDGKHALFYRPYHLVGCEAPISIIEAAINHRATGAHLPTRTADVVAIAKRNIAAGETLSGIGGAMVRGEMIRYDQFMAHNLLPLSLAENVKAARDIKKGERLSYADVEPSDSRIWKLRAQQDERLQ